MGRMLIWIGTGLAVLGLTVIALGGVLSALGAKGGRLLPGDIVVSRPGFRFVLPIATSLAASAVLTLLLWLFAAWRR